MENTVGIDYYCLGDTISISDTLYTEIRYSWASVNWKNYSTNIFFAYFRQDTDQKRVYLRMTPGDPEFIVYDFNLKVGDTIHFPGDHNSPEVYPVQGVVLSQDSILIFIPADINSQFKPIARW
jgi:hypothetical protein